MKLVLERPLADRGGLRAGLVGSSKLCHCSQQCSSVQHAADGDDEFCLDVIVKAQFKRDRVLCQR